MPCILPGLGVGGDCLGVERRRVDVHAGARLHDVDDDQADDQRDRADDLEVEQRQAAGLADLLHVLHAGDADDDGAEDDRRDDHLDQLDEAVAERLHRLAGLRAEVAEQDADDDRDDDLEVERLVERLAGSGPCPWCLLELEMPVSDAGREGLPVGVVARAHQRATGGVGKAHRARLRCERLELLPAPRSAAPAGCRAAAAGTGRR